MSNEISHGVEQLESQTIVNLLRVLSMLRNLNNLAHETCICT